MLYIIYIIHIYIKYTHIDIYYIIYIHVYNTYMCIDNNCKVTCTEEATEMAAKYLHNKKMCF